MNERVLLAYHMFEQEGVGAPLPSGVLGKEVQKNIMAHPIRKERLRYIATLCEGIQSPLALYTRAYALSWSGAAARPDAICAMLEYIHNGVIPSELPNNEQTEKLRAWDWYTLGQAYEGEYQFSEAYEAYAKALSLHPALSPAAIKQSEVLVKMGKIDDAINQLKAYQASKACTPQLEASVAFYIKKIEEQKKKGYVFKPKKKSKTSS